VRLKMERVEGVIVRSIPENDQFWIEFHNNPELWMICSSVAIQLASVSYKECSP